jgi:Spy/CpxP family protein refolding chaperone
MKKAMSLSFAVLTFATLSAFAQAGPGDGPPGGGGGRRMEMLMQRLNLTAEQKTSWDAIEAASRTANQPLMDQRRTLHDKMDAMLDASNPDVAALGTLMVQAHAIDKQLKASREAVNAKLSGLLTADQKTQFERFMAGPPPGMRN